MPVLIKPVKFGQDNSIENAPELTEEEKNTIQARMKELDKLLADKKKAKYKIEIFFNKARSSWKPTAAMISFWESGAKLNGGGDAKIYMCPGFRKNSWDPQKQVWTSTPKGKGPCSAFIPDASHGYGHLFCPRCKVLWAETEVAGEIVAKLTMLDWSVLLTKYYARLDCNADIYLKYAPDDIRSRAREEQDKQKGGELLHKARMSRRRAVSLYPLRNIIKDTGGGQDLATKFLQFLRA